MPAQQRNPARQPSGYLTLSTRPLHVLVFLIPFMVLYEVGSIYYLQQPSRGVVETIGARSFLAGFFDAFGAASLHIPPIVLCVVLLIWHLLEKDSWRVRGWVIVGMAAESLLWTLPLLVFGLSFPFTHAAAGVNDPSGLTELSWQARLTLSAGAGVYEELLFRLVLISAVHFVIVDLMQGTDRVGKTIAVIVSAVCFALYHNVVQPGGGVDLQLVIYYAIAGFYFAGLFIFRGFGMCVAAHALFDAIVLVVIPSR